MRYFVAVLLLSAYCFGQHKDFDSDGSYWRDSSQTVKAGYISGYISAMSYAQIGSAMTCMSIENPKDRNAQASKACISNAQSYDFDSITVGQLLDGMNAFYKDFRNFKVPMTMAMRLVRDEIRGRTEQDVQKELDSWRQCVAGDFDKCYPAAKPETK